MSRLTQIKIDKGLIPSWCRYYKKKQNFHISKRFSFTPLFSSSIVYAVSAMAKLLLAVTIAVLALGTVIPQGMALLLTFPEHNTVYAFKATIDGQFLSRSSTDRIEAAGGTSTPPGSASRFRLKVLPNGKVTFQVPASSLEYVRRMSPGQDIEVDSTTQDAQTEFSYEFNPQGPGDSGYLRLIADDGNYWNIANGEIGATATSVSASTQLIVVKLILCMN